ncbi:DUF3574 domain-containing protein [Kribbella sandramycini]|uniref:DUF3574 domain-containing protein n=1 Tax=Kribbella sandramycini TaxID=60450 RepID=A0A7Y4KVB6_9ACTN|nr:DUF3574 domain-containing protein [Kribbella sandramycini]MBB6568023.1 hypothetical protein [Kribbella sandramycini]NOL39383.1 DUF3574 domain-containing protein [Kribbella sandramycini]
MRNLGKTAATTALVLTALGAPAAVALQADDPAHTWVRTELFFGTDKPGPDVTDYQFQKFVDSTVTPRFPDGLTVLSGQGQWNGGKGIVKERSKVLIIVYPVDGAEASSKKIEEIRDLYEKKFQQQSVLRADSSETVSF